MLQGMWDAWQAGDRRAALDAIPDELVDQLIVHGSPQECREQIRRYVRAGVTVPVIALLGPYGDLSAALRGLAPGG
jgi:alkanesulfonate monooxygenase SsuD/methylene tetrahydromethanopterin reductase-like flavin-dependent oxidoreductase (luciferase family)